MESNWANIAVDTEDSFPGEAVERGWDYFEKGRVTLRAVGSNQAHALVRGNHVYRVEVSVEPAARGVEPACNCPASRKGLCEHMFATLLELEARARGSAPAAPPEWERQLDQLPGTETRDPWLDVPGATARPHIVLCERHTILTGIPTIRIMFRARLKNGAWSVPKEVRSTGRIPRFDPEGQRLFARAAHLDMNIAGHVDPFMVGYERFDQREMRAPGAREDLIALARARVLYMGEMHGPPEEEPLTFDENGPFAFGMKLKPTPSGGLRLSAGLSRGELHVALDTPLILLKNGLMVLDNTLAAVDYSDAFKWATQLRSIGPIEVPAEGHADLMARLLKHGTPLPLDGPLPRPPSTDTSPPPVRATLQLHLAQYTRYNDSRYRSGPDLLPGDVEFHYGEGMVAPESPAACCADTQPERLIPRDFEQESALLARLIQLGAKPGGRNTTHTALLPGGSAIRIATTLRREGWAIESDGTAWREADEFSLRVSSGIDWFDLEGGLRYDKQTVGIPEILDAVRKGEDAITLKDGSRGLLPQGLAERLGLLTELATHRDDGLRFSKNQGWILDVLLAEQDANYAADSGFKALRKRVAAFDGIRPRDANSQFTGELRLYQRDALGWFRFLQTMELGGCLADDMGLGKTVMVLAQLLDHRRATRNSDRKPALVVAPKSLVWNWIEEARRFAPSLRVLDYSGPASERDPARIPEHDLAVTTYGVLRRDAERLRDVPLGYAILDEAQAVKNPASQAWKAARLLRADHRLALTGTPVENHLGDLWAIMEFLNPGMLGPRSTHRAWARSNRNKNGEGGGSRADTGGDSAALRNRVARLIRPVLLRRTKEEVLKELPPRQETLLHCEMGPRQRKCYTELRDHYRDKLLHRIDSEGLAKSKMHVLEALLRLRQVACHPGLLDAQRASQPSAKFDALLPRLEEVKESGRKALVFSQFTSLLAILKDRLDAEGIHYAYLDGKSRKRDRIVESFQEDADLPLFLISLKAGGVGLNLTAADHVFLLDPWWNPAVERQAVDRTHRIGQTKVVNVYRLVTTDTVEERILELQDRKRELAEAIVGSDSGLLNRLTRDDLAALLGG
jgi:Superfamily II DNA/RNA helicases, SNF2 family